MLLKTIEDIVDNYKVSASDATGDLWRGFVENGRWRGWSGTWVQLRERNRMHLIRAMVELDSATPLLKQGCAPRCAVLVRQGTGFLMLKENAGDVVQGYGTRLTFGPVDSEWGIAACFPYGSTADTDIAITSLLYQRYLP